MLARTIPASPAEVFDAWLDPECPGSMWFGSGRAIVSRFEVDGLFWHTVEGMNGRTYAHYGRFTKLARPGLVEHTWVSEATRGTETLVRVTFEARGDNTELTLTHHRVPDDAEGHRHRPGWARVLDAMKDHYEQTKGKKP